MKHHRTVVFLTDFLTESPFSYFKQNTFSDNASFAGYSASLVQLIKNAGIVLIAISILVLFLRWGLTRKDDKKNRLMAPLMWKLSALVVLGGFAYFVVLVYRIFDSMVAQMAG